MDKIGDWGGRAGRGRKEKIGERGDMIEQEGETWSNEKGKQ